MAPRRGSRRITVDGATYRWQVRRKPTYCQAMGFTPLSFSVELAVDEARTVLVVETEALRPDSVLGASVRSPAQKVAAAADTVAPASVAHCIRDAIASGWNPAQAGKPFQFA